ncbi:unnamed protein product [Parajaminaea phylloscopi]
MVNPFERLLYKGKASRRDTHFDGSAQRTPFAEDNLNPRSSTSAQASGSTATGPEAGNPPSSSPTTASSIGRPHQEPYPRGRGTAMLEGSASSPLSRTLRGKSKSLGQPLDFAADTQESLRHRARSQTLLSPSRSTSTGAVTGHADDLAGPSSGSAPLPMPSSTSPLEGSTPVSIEARRWGRSSRTGVPVAQKLMRKLSVLSGNPRREAPSPTVMTSAHASRAPQERLLRESQGLELAAPDSGRPANQPGQAQVQGVTHVPGLIVGTPPQRKFSLRRALSRRGRTADLAVNEAASSAPTEPTAPAQQTSDTVAPGSDPSQGGSTPQHTSIGSRPGLTSQTSSSSAGKSGVSAIHRKPVPAYKTSSEEAQSSRPSGRRDTGKQRLVDTARPRNDSIPKDSPRRWGSRKMGVALPSPRLSDDIGALADRRASVEGRGLGLSLGSPASTVSALGRHRSQRHEHHFDVAAPTREQPSDASVPSALSARLSQDAWRESAEFALAARVLSPAHGAPGIHSFSPHPPEDGGEGSPSSTSTSRAIVMVRDSSGAASTMEHAQPDESDPVTTWNQQLLQAVHRPYSYVSTAEGDTPISHYRQLMVDTTNDPGGTAAESDHEDLFLRRPRGPFAHADLPSAGVEHDVQSTRQDADEVTTHHVASRRDNEAGDQPPPDAGRDLQPATPPLSLVDVVAAGPSPDRSRQRVLPSLDFASNPLPERLNPPLQELSQSTSQVQTSDSPEPPPELANARPALIYLQQVAHARDRRPRRAVSFGALRKLHRADDLESDADDDDGTTHRPGQGDLFVSNSRPQMTTPPRTFKRSHDTDAGGATEAGSSVLRPQQQSENRNVGGSNVPEGLVSKSSEPNARPGRQRRAQPSTIAATSEDAIIAHQREESRRQQRRARRERESVKEQLRKHAAQKKSDPLLASRLALAGLDHIPCTPPSPPRMASSRTEQLGEAAATRQVGPSGSAPELTHSRDPNASGALASSRSSHYNNASASGSSKSVQGLDLARRSGRGRRSTSLSTRETRAGSSSLEGWTGSSGQFSASVSGAPSQAQGSAAFVTAGRGTTESTLVRLIKPLSVSDRSDAGDFTGLRGTGLPTGGDHTRESLTGTGNARALSAAPTATRLPQVVYTNPNPFLQTTSQSTSTDATQGLGLDISSNNDSAFPRIAASPRKTSENELRDSSSHHGRIRSEGLSPSASSTHTETPIPMLEFPSPPSSSLTTSFRIPATLGGQHPGDLEVDPTAFERALSQAASAASGSVGSGTTLRPRRLAGPEVLADVARHHNPVHRRHVHHRHSRHGSLEGHLPLSSAAQQVLSHHRRVLSNLESGASSLQALRPSRSSPRQVGSLVESTVDRVPDPAPSSSGAPLVRSVSRGRGVVTPRGITPARTSSELDPAGQALTEAMLMTRPAAPQTESDRKHQSYIATVEADPSPVDPPGGH